MKVVLFANTDWFLYNFKLALANALRARGDEVVLLSPPGEYGQRLREMGFRWEPLPVSRSGVNPLAELMAVRRVHALYRALQPDLVHHFTIKCVIYGSFAARMAGVKRVVNSVTGLGFALLADTFKARLIRPVVLALYRHALRGTAVVFQNADNRDTLQRHGVLARSRVYVVAGDGIDTDVFVPVQSSATAALVEREAFPLSRPPATLPLGGGNGNAGVRQTVLMMARLLQSKGVAEFVAAAALVRARMPDVEFLLAGAPDPGNPEAVDEASLREWQAQGHVQFLGHRSDALALNQACSIAVLASTQGEGIPRSLLEAAACGKPLVATDVPGCRDLVQAGKTGFLVPPGDASALAEALLQLLGDESLRARMGAAARVHVEQGFSDQRVNAQIFEIYGAEV